MEFSKTAFFYLLLFCATSSNASPVFHEVMHTPLHPGNNEAITFRLHTESATGISQITLEIFEHDYFLNPDGSRGASRRTTGQWGQVKTWTFVSARLVVDTSFVFPTGFPAHTFLQYRFTVQDAGSTSTRTISMQAGASPFGNREILLYSASTDPPRNTFHVCFVPDTRDYGVNLKRFLTDLGITIYEGYLSNNMIRPQVEEWAFYYTPVTANSETRVIPPVMAPAGYIDAFGFIHIRNFRDARSGRRFSSEYNMRGTVVHETGHAIFNLSDEYRNSNVIATACNVFTTQTACQNATGLNCRSFNGSGGRTYYSPEPTVPNCIMNNDGDTRMQSFQAHCQACITNAYAELNRQVIAIPAMTNDTVGPFQVEKVLVVKITSTPAGFTAEVLDTAYGKPTLNIQPGKDMGLRFLDMDNKTLYRLSIDDPRVYYIDDGPVNNGNQKRFMTSGVEYIRIPFYKDISMLQITGLNEFNNGVNKTLDISKGIQHFLK